MDGLKDLANKNIDAFVGDEPVIRYLINHKFKNQLTVLPKGFDREYLGFGLPEDSPLRKRIDLILLSIIHSKKWPDLTRTYLGVDAGMKTRKTNFINN
jgi:ABC-type amino acid transport substrate-binding protein